MKIIRIRFIIQLEDTSFRSVVYKEKIQGIKQLELLQGGARCMVGSAFTSMSARVSIKMFPEGDTMVMVEYPYKKFVPAVLIQVHLKFCLDKDNQTNFNRKPLTL